MKKRSLIGFFAAVFTATSTLLTDGNELQAQDEEWSYRQFFQIVNMHSNGSASRFTGCVTEGGNCLTQGPEVDQDCYNNGIWVPCGWE